MLRNLILRFSIKPWIPSSIGRPNFSTPSVLEQSSSGLCSASFHHQYSTQLTHTRRCKGDSTRKLLPPDSPHCHFVLNSSSDHPSKSSKNQEAHMRSTQSKPSKPSAKLFTFRDKTDDRDLEIKFGKIKHLLEKGKCVQVILKDLERTEGPKSAVKNFNTKLADVFQEMCEIQENYSNKKTVKFTLNPISQKVADEPPETMMK